MSNLLVLVCYYHKNSFILHIGWGLIMVLESNRRSLIITIPLVDELAESSEAFACCIDLECSSARRL
jgi:hypothetical protein